MNQFELLESYWIGEPISPLSLSITLLVTLRSAPPLTLIATPLIAFVREVATFNSVVWNPAPLIA